MRKIDEKTGIPLGFLVSLVIGAGTFWGYCEAHFATASSVNTMQDEIHQIYDKLIPAAERATR